MQGRLASSSCRDRRRTPKTIVEVQARLTRRQSRLLVQSHIMQGRLSMQERLISAQGRLIMQERLIMVSRWQDRQRTPIVLRHNSFRRTIVEMQGRLVIAQGQVIVQSLFMQGRLILQGRVLTLQDRLVMRELLIVPSSGQGRQRAPMISRRNIFMRTAYWPMMMAMLR